MVSAADGVSLFLGQEILDVFKLGNLTNQRTSQIHVGQRNQFWLAADYCIRCKLLWELEKKKICRVPSTADTGCSVIGFAGSTTMQ